MTATSQEEQDAALARALQKQYERDDAVAAAPSPPPAAATVISLRNQKLSNGKKNNTTATTTTMATMSKDEQMARRLQAEEDVQAQSHAMDVAMRAAATTTTTATKAPTASRTARNSSAASSKYHDEPTSLSMTTETNQTNKNSRSNKNKNQTRPVAIVVNGGSSGFADDNNNKSDEQVAEQMQQEMTDAEIAARLQRHEERKAAREQRKREGAQPRSSSYRSGLSNNSQSRSTRESFYKYSGYVFPVNEQGKCTRPQRRHYIGMTLLVLVAAGIIVAMFVHFIILDGDVPAPIAEFVGDITGTEEFANQDPFGGDGTPTPWQTSGNGLQLEVLNALQPKWYDFFYKAIRDWDDGYPDALTLQTTVVDYDPNCTAVTGKVKVCNANYGATKWRGILDFSTVDGYMTVAVARMNENYTGNVDTDRVEMHYVMCHELGHAWGLVHSDENFDNADLNDCLEYTRTPQTSQTPADFQFVNLYKLYGLVADAAPYSSPPTPAPVVQVGGGGGGGATRRRTISWQRQPQEDPTTTSPEQQRQRPPPPVMLRHQQNDDTEKTDEEWLEEAILSVYHRPTGQMLDPSQWTLVHRNEFSEAHEIDLTSWWYHRHHHRGVDRHDDDEHQHEAAQQQQEQDPHNSSQQLPPLPRQHVFRVHKLLALTDTHAAAGANGKK